MEAIIGLLGLGLFIHLKHNKHEIFVETVARNVVLFLFNFLLHVAL